MTGRGVDRRDGRGGHIPVNKMKTKKSWCKQAEGKFLVRTKPPTELITMSYPIRRDLFIQNFIWLKLPTNSRCHYQQAYDKLIPKGN